jgi:hypothetical protein
MRSSIISNSFPNIIILTKSRRIMWADHVARMEDIRNSFNILSDNLMGRDYLQSLDVDMQATSKSVLKEGVNPIWLGVGTSYGLQ